MKEFFVINGHKVEYHHGLAEFHKYGILIRCEPAHFTYDWAMKMDFKLSVLQGII